MSGRFFLALGALLMLSSIAFADGEYQRTKDGKTLVWNNDPNPDDQATWSGDRDTNGYAHGFGTLSWYSKTGIFARYWGNMVKGRLDGSVNAHSKGKTAHAMFVEGTRMTRWASGRASAREAARWHAATGNRSTVREPEPPAEGPVFVERKPTPSPGPKPAVTESSEDLASTSDPPRPLPSVTPAPAAPEIDEPLQLLVWPPPFLDMRYIIRSPRTDITARLLRGEVIDLADTTARSRGYNPTNYALPEPQYDPADQAWSLLYEHKPADGTVQTSKHFSIAVGDKTKQTALVPGR